VVDRHSSEGDIGFVSVPVPEELHTVRVNTDLLPV
jgi:hypothetical protein